MSRSESFLYPTFRPNLCNLLIHVQYALTELDRLVYVMVRLRESPIVRERSWKNKVRFLYGCKMLADRLGRTRFASSSIKPIHLFNDDRIALKTKNESKICVYLVPKVPVM